jgi:hypothetical protein
MCSSFPIPIFSQHITPLLYSTVSLLQESASRCVYHILLANPNSFRDLIRGGLLDAIQQVLVRTASLDVAESLVHACEIASQHSANALGARVGLGPILAKYQLFSISQKRLVAKTLSQPTNRRFLSKSIH